MWYSRISKLANSSISKRFTYKNHPHLNQNASLKSPLISSKYGYTNYPNNLYLVKHYHNSGVVKNILLGTPKRTFKYHYQQKLAIVSKPRIGFVTLTRISFLFIVLVIFTSPVIVIRHVLFSQKIPYTNRTQIVIAPPSWEKMYGDIIFERVQLRTLPEEHPDSVRVKMIGEKIVEALESDLKGMKNQNVSVEHLEGFKWKFIVVDDPVVTAYSIIGGKIFVNTGLLKKLESDAEIATIIGHEVGHNVARHVANRNNMRMLVFITRALLGLAGSMKMYDHNPHGVSKWIRVLFQYPSWRRQESEADDIGLLIMASAGYDPQAAPKVYEIFENKSSDFYDMHPSGKKRAKKLAAGRVMKEASSIYSNVIETRKKNDLKDH